MATIRRRALAGHEQRPQRLFATGIKPVVAAGMGVAAFADDKIAPTIDRIDKRRAAPGGT